MTASQFRFIRDVVEEKVEEAKQTWLESNHEIDTEQFEIIYKQKKEALEEFEAWYFGRHDRLLAQ